VINTWFVINIMINKPLHMAIGAGFLIVGVPVFLVFKRRQKLAPEGTETAGED